MSGVLLPIKRLNLALQLDHQRLAFAVTRFARSNFDPAFADAVFLHVGTLLVVPANTDVALEHGGDVMRAAWVDGEAVGQGGKRWRLGGVIHGGR